MEESSGGGDGVLNGKDGVTGLAAKVRDIEGKNKLKSILKKPSLKTGESNLHSGEEFPEGLASGVQGVPVGEDNVHGSTSENVHGNNAYPSYAAAVQKPKPGTKVDFRVLRNDLQVEGSDVVIPESSIKEVSAKFDNTLYGYFIGKRLAYPIVDQFARNAWAKFGFKRSMMNGKGFFFFQFDSKVGMDRVLEEGPWMIRNIPIILNVWTPSVSLSKEGIKVVPVWVKMHDIPLVAFSEIGLSLIATKLGNPKRLDGYTSDMCRDLWGRSSFARALIEVSSEKDLVEEVVVAIPSIDGEGFVKEKVRVEYDWKPPRCGGCCVFGHTDANCIKNMGEKPVEVENGETDEGFKTVKGKKKMHRNKRLSKQHEGKPVSGNKSGLYINPKIIYKPVSQPLELPVYRKRAAEWKKKHPQSTSNRYEIHGQKNSTKSAEVQSSNRYDVLASDDPDDDTDIEEVMEVETVDGKNEGASTPNNGGFNG